MKRSGEEKVPAGKTEGKTSSQRVANDRKGRGKIVNPALFVSNTEVSCSSSYQSVKSALRELKLRHRIIATERNRKRAALKLVIPVVRIVVPIIGLVV